MPVTRKLGEFIISVSGIVDHNIGIVYERQNGGIENVVAVLGIGDITNRVIVEIYAMGNSAAGMVQTKRFDHYPVTKIELVAGIEITIFDICLHAIGSDGKEWRFHELPHHLFTCHTIEKVPGPDPGIVSRAVKRAEKRQPENVVVMTMTEQQVDIIDTLGAQGATGSINAGSGVKDKHPVAAAHFNATRIAASTQTGRRRSRHAAPYTPEFDAKRRHCQSSAPISFAGANDAVG
jgi:hypothetical protein